jgi:hypothetical protein
MKALVRIRVDKTVTAVSLYHLDIRVRNFGSGFGSAFFSALVINQVQRGWFLS